MGGITRDWEELSDIFLKATEEDSAVVSGLIGDIEDLGKIVDQTAGKVGDIGNFRGTMIDNAEATEMLKEKYQELNDTLNLIVRTYAELNAQKVNIRDVFTAS